MAPNTIERVDESDLKTDLAVALISEQSDDSLHMVNIGEGPDAHEVIFGQALDAAYVLVRGEGRQKAWQGDPESMAGRFRQEVESYINNVPKEFDETIRVDYSPGWDDPVEFDFSDASVDVDFTQE